MENSVLLTKKKLTMDKFLSQIKITTDNEIKKVLGVSARSTISACDFAGGSVTVSGKVFVSAIFLNTEGDIEQASATLDISQKQQANIVLENCFAVDDAKIDYYTGSGNDVLCSVSHEVCISGNFKYEIPKFQSDENNLVLSTKTEKITNFVTSAEDNFVVAEEVESNIKDMVVVFADAKALVSSAVCSADKVIVEGKVIAEIVCKDADGLTQMQKEFDFKQEIETSNTLPNMQALACLAVKNATISPEVKDDKTFIVCSFDVFAKCYVYDEGTIDLVSDMFSLSHELKLSEAVVDAKNYKRFTSGANTVSAVTPVADIENFDDVETVYGINFKQTEIKDLGTRAVIYGNISANAVYFAGGEQFVLNVSTEAQIEVEKLDAETIGNISVIATLASFKVKAGKELETTFKLDCTGELETELSLSYISNFEQTKEKETDNGGIKVYITKQGETLFDIAKVLSVKPEIIENQNEVDGVFEQGEKIYVYSQANLL